MATEIYDHYGKRAPTVAVTELRRRPGRVLKLTDRRGAVGISRDGATIAVALSLDQFVSILFGIHARPRRKKREARGKAQRRR